jgi:glycosyltransferase involved in cell wall biosynthesis
VSLHVAVSGWMLGPPSGANRRLLALLQHAAPLLRGDERVTVVHAQAFVPPALHARIGWRAAAIPAGPTARRVLAERRVLPRLLRELGITALDHGLLPVPRVPCPVLLTVHDLRDADGHGPRPRWLARRVVRSACRRAERVLVPSEFTRRRLLAVAPAARVDVVANGTDPAAVVAEPEPATGPGHRGPLLHVGHLEPRKNLAVVLRALALLPEDQRPDLQLVGADAGAGRSLRALTAQLGLSASVQFLGAVADGELQQLYAAAGAIVVPSRYEGFGLCALEGLAHGRPVLVADAGALPEVTGDAATVLPADDAAAWARAIAARDRDGRSPEVRRARAAVFAWPRAAAQLVAAWRSLPR